MRAIWSGEITFGLVNVPVKLYGATRSHDLSFHQVHDEDQGRIRYQRICEVCGREIDYEHIDKAYDDGDKTVVLTDEELADLPAEDNDEIDVVQFVPGDQVDPILLGTSYFLEPVGRSSKAYVLLRRTLEDTERTAVVTFTLRSKTRLGVLRVHEDLLALQTLRWPTDLQDVDFGPSRTTISAKERKMSAALVEQFSGDFDPEQFTDEYQEQLRELVDAKLEEGDAIDTEATFGKDSSTDDDAGDGKVISLMDALERSVQKKRSAGSSASGRTTTGSTRSSATNESSGTEKRSSTTKKKSGTTKKKSGSTKKKSGSTKKSA
ncbi:non-homologous end joining protein Ku [Brachybacterium sp. J153]|uniref:non-homologous end joining protein Ku n=1 Tax=Brachybacterium sp. J153 TaxID=3116488 RepID=UPI002E77464C|nr:Ku protein [Brachybacterium sp. J153]MEE1619656.1 Ku protein [Brachybacterium sp. J153]